MAGLVNEGWAVGVVHLDFRKAFDTVSDKILVDKLLNYGLKRQTAMWIENWLNGQSQRMVISDAESSWRPATSRVPQVSILCPVLFSVVIGWWGRVFAQQVWWRHRTGRSGRYSRGLCCHPKGPQQAVEMVWQEPQGMLNPALGEEQPQAPGHAGGHTAGKQLCRKGPGGFHQIKHEPPIVPLVLRRLKAFLTALGKALPAGQERWS